MQKNMIKANKKIAYITNARMPTEKAHGLQIAKMCEAFGGEVEDVTLYLPNRKNHISEPVFNYYGISESAFSVRKTGAPDMTRLRPLMGFLADYLQRFVFLMRLLFFFLPEGTVVFTRDPEIAWLFSKRGYATIFEAHRPPTSKQTLYRQMLQDISCVVCNSAGTAEALQQMEIQNTYIAPNGVDIDHFDMTLSREEAREKVQLPENKTILLYAGSLYKWKGVDFVISAWNEKLHKDDNLCLVFVGGHAEDRDRLKEKLAYPDRVHFIPPVKHKQVPVYLKSADVLLLPSTAESEESAKYTSPIKMFEYMASKRPIVAGGLPSIARILSEAEAYLFKPDNPESFAQAIHEAREDKEDRAERAYQRSLEYSWERRAERILKCIE